MFTTSPERGRGVLVTLATVTALLALPPAASVTAAKSTFFEEAAEAFWEVPHVCADGSTVSGTLLVRSTRDFASPATEDLDPTARVQFLAVCPGGISFSWGAPTAPAVITSTNNLRSVTASGSGIARDNLGGAHQVSFDVTWTGVGPVERIVNGPGSTTKLRTATATGQVTFDGAVLADGPANHPTRPAPFIRVDVEK